jgi:hypothetical protein
MAKELTYTGRMGGLQRFNLALTANKAELQDLELSRVKYDGMVNRIQDLANRQAALRAEKQELSKQLRTELIETERMGNMMRKAVQAHYGIRAEKLAEFGLQPFRGRPRVAQTTPEPPATTPTPTPAQPATQHPTTPVIADAAK